MRAGRPGFADGVHKGQLGAAIGRQVLNKEDALAFGHSPLNAGVAAVAFGFLAHVGHGQGHAFSNKRREGDARGFAASDVVECLKPCIAHDRYGEEVHQRRADARIRDQLAAIDIGG